MFGNGCPDVFFDIRCCAYICAKLGHRGAFGRDVPHLDEDTWTRDNDNRIAAWNAQLEQNRAEQEAQERIANEEEEAPASPTSEKWKPRSSAELGAEKSKGISAFDQVGNWIEAR